MDSRTHLDYALFQLTPTRTRCDLVIFSGGSSEKLASGLFQPFLSHLKFAKDEISKGGYSITLRPLANASPWFTKGTFQRFVSFVSTPEVLERFVSLEKEISQIDDSVQASEPSTTNVSVQLTEGRLSVANGSTKKSTDFSKLRHEAEQKTDTIEEESSKFHLQRLLESRKALLRKEQAMAYARALVIGFELNYIDELISFADAFGASRLRQACINFNDLCKKKHSDVLWMDELAAMKACSPSELSFLGTSGIVLTDEISGPSPNDNNSAVSDQTTTPDKVHVQMPWPNQIPHYVYNFQNPMQQGLPYQGYTFPPMQYHPMNMQSRSSMDESIHGPMQPNYHRKSSSAKKDKFSKQRKLEYSEEDVNSESGDSESGSDSELYVAQDTKHSSAEENPSRKKQRKKSSKTVIIRNINYITSKKGDGVSDNSPAEDELFDGNCLKQMEDAVGSLEKHHKSSSRKHKKKGGDASRMIINGSHDHDNLDTDIPPDGSELEEKQENWDTFQNLLMINDETTIKGVEKQQMMDADDEQFTIRSTTNESYLAANNSVTLGSEKVRGRRIIAADSFVMSDKDVGMESRTKSEHFENEEDFRPRTKSANEELLFSQRMDDSRSELRVIPSDCVTESVIKNRKEENWFIVNQSEVDHGIVNKKSFLDGDDIGKIVKDSFGDDSFMVQERPANDDPYASQWKTDIVADLSLVRQPENSIVDKAQEKREFKHEPDDLCMVLERSYKLESPDASWNMDYGIDMSVTETVRKSSVVTEHDVKLPLNNKNPNNNIAVSKTKEQGKEGRPALRGSIGKSKSHIMSTTRKPSSITRTGVQKSKLEKEEEMRKKMEELVLERQRRIAERTAARGVAPAASKKTSLVKTAETSIKDEKNKIRAKVR